MKTTAAECLSLRCTVGIRRAGEYHGLRIVGGLELLRRPAQFERSQPTDGVFALRGIHADGHNAVAVELVADIGEIAGLHRYPLLSGVAWSERTSS